VIAFAWLSMLVLLTAVYALFTVRMRAGLRLLRADASVEHDTVPDEALPSLTVVVPMRNERGNIPRLLSSLRGQDYPVSRREVLFVDDHSDDGGVELLETLVEHEHAERVLRMPAGRQGKKAAIAHAVAYARGTVIVSTDADCVHKAGWLRAMAQPFVHGADVVAGPVVLDGEGGMFGRMQALEFLGLVGVGAGFFGIGYPRMCNGANLAYSVARFHEAGGYADNQDVHSGDDEFLLRTIVYRLGGAAHFVTDEPAIVRTAAQRGVFAFLRQRVRWVSKSRYNEDGRFVSFLVLLFAYFVGLLGLPVIAVTGSAAAALSLLLWVVKMVLDGLVLFPAARLFRQPIRLPDLLVAELLHPVYLVLVSLLGIRGSFAWKGRRLRNRRSRSAISG